MEIPPSDASSKLSKAQSELLALPNPQSKDLAKLNNAELTDLFVRLGNQEFTPEETSRITKVIKDTASNSGEGQSRVLQAFQQSELRAPAKGVLKLNKNPPTLVLDPPNGGTPTGAKFTADARGGEVGATSGVASIAG